MFIPLLAKIGMRFAKSKWFMVTVSLLAATRYAPAAVVTKASDFVLPRNAVVPLTVFSRFFPEITQEASTGQNLTAVGKPKATRSVIYTSSDSSKKVTITVDQYASARDASAAYQEAVQKSKVFRALSQSPRRISARTRLSGP